MRPQPNILYLHGHDMGRYVQPYGYAIETPNLQRLAEQGVMFRQAFCASPACSASRAALLTGCYPHCNGMIGLAHRGGRLHDYRQHIIHTLGRAGYVSALAGVQHIARPPLATTQDIGYDRVLVDGNDPMPTTQAALDFLANPPDQPFFLSVGYFPPHRSGEHFRTLVPTPDARYCRPPAPLPDTPTTRADMAEYIASVQSTDLCMGRVLEALDRSHLSQNTLVIATTDHGVPFPGMKCTLTDHGIGVMLMMRGPADSEFVGGRVVDTMVSHMDLFPTLCQWLNIEPPNWLQGKSVLPLLRNEVDHIHQALYAEMNYHSAYEPQRAVRTPRWKYIRRFDDRTSPVLTNTDNSPSKLYWYEQGWPQRPRPTEMLFDLVFDPNETDNLIDAGYHDDVLNTLRDDLRDWMRETNDPLLTGDVPLPAGAVIIDPDAYSPNGGPPPA